MDQIFLAAKKSVSIKGQIPNDLFHRGLVGLARNPGYLNAPGGELNNEENVEAYQACKSRDLDREEVLDFLGGFWATMELRPLEAVH